METKKTTVQVVKKQPTLYQWAKMSVTGQPPPPPKLKRTAQAQTKRLPGLINDRPHVTLICGRKGSGKSFLCCKLLCSWTGWRGVYDEIIFVSPTFKSQFDGLWSKIDPAGVTVHERIDEQFIENLLQEQSTSTKNSLLILDDCGEDLRKVSPSTVNKLVSNSRHYKLSIICLHQKLTQSPTIMRANADSVVSFAACSYLERDCLWREVSTVDKKEFLRIFNQATTEKHSFLVSTIDKGGRLRFYESDFTTTIT